MRKIKALARSCPSPQGRLGQWSQNFRCPVLAVSSKTESSATPSENGCHSLKRGAAPFELSSTVSFDCGGQGDRLTAPVPHLNLGVGLDTFLGQNPSGSEEWGSRRFHQELEPPVRELSEGLLLGEVVGDGPARSSAQLRGSDFRPLP